MRSAAEVDLPGRVVITGGSSGVGLACAHMFAASGASVGLIGRSSARLESASDEVRETTGGNVFISAADVSDETSLRPALDRLAGDLGGIDALVVCAGIEGEMGATVDEVTAAGFQEVLAVNVLGAFLAVQAALPHLRRSTDASITLIGSDSGFVAAPGMLAYNASKGAIVQLTRALAVELFDTDGIRVNSVAPSIIDTPMARRGLGDEVMDAPNFPLQSADDVAWSVGYLSNRRSRAINGVSLLSDFGYTGRSSFPA